MRRRLTFALLGLFVSLLFYRSARADTHDCVSTPGASDYVAQREDVEDAQHISLVRDLAGIHNLELTTCVGELQIERSPDARLHLSIASRTHLSHPMHAYIEHLRLCGETATIALDFPKAKFVNIDSSKGPSVIVTIQLPGGIRKSEINLGAGKLLLADDALSGDREINLGAGDVHLTLDGDRDYSRFEANVGMGSFHDNRKGGRNSHFIISRSYSGSGTGRLEVNVGAGSIDIDPPKSPR